MSGTRSIGESPSTMQLNQNSNALFQNWFPLMQQLSGAGQDIMKTGGTQATIPLISNMIQNMRSALSNTMQSTQQRLGQTRQAGTPFGQRLLAQTQLQGETGIAQAGPMTSMDFLKTILGVGSAGTGQAQSGMGSAAQSESNIISSENRAYSEVLSSMIGAAGKMMEGTGAGAVAAMCWIAEALYGPMDHRTWLVRWWVIFEAPEWVRVLYRRYGRQLAASRAIVLFQPVFAVLVWRARREFYR